MGTVCSVSGLLPAFFTEQGHIDHDEHRSERSSSEENGPSSNEELVSHHHDWNIDRIITPGDLVDASSLTSVGVKAGAPGGENTATSLRTAVPSRPVPVSDQSRGRY